MPAWISPNAIATGLSLRHQRADGDTSGESRLSWWKVALLVLIGLVFFYLWVVSQ
jgi:ABC-type siderophore export system fused ATPase/permease subunit